MGHYADNSGPAYVHESGIAAEFERFSAMKIEKAFIATPTAGGIVTTSYAATLVAVTIALKQRNINYRFRTLDGSDVVFARNYLANTFLQDATCTHILFIDSDMAISRQVLALMLDSGKAFIGAVYPERRLDLEVYSSFLLKGYTHQEALSLALKYNVKHLGNQVPIENGLCRVRHFGFGCVLIARSVFEELVAHKRVERLVSPMMQKVDLTGDAYDFFSPVSMENGGLLSEDYSFCERVNRLAASEIWAVVGETVGHVGQFTYGAPYIDRLKARQRTAGNPPAAKVAK